MALKATIFKAQVQIADLDRNYFGEHALTLARHPSETDERMMIRLLAFMLEAGPDLSFGKGLSSDDEPALWEIDPTGAIACWIDVGVPDEERVRKASRKAGRVVVLAYGARAVDVWWSQNSAAFARLANLEVWRIDAEGAQALAALAERTMTLSCTRQDGVVYVDGVELHPQRLQ